MSAASGPWFAGDAACSQSVAATRWQSSWFANPVPTGVTVSISGGWPSFARSRLIVIRTVLVNGWVASSHTRTSSSSLETTDPAAASRTSSTANSFADSGNSSPARRTTRLEESSSSSS